LRVLNEKAVAAGFRPGSFTEFNILVNKDFKPADSSVFKTLETIFFVDNIAVTPDLASIVTVLKVDNSGKDLVTRQYEQIDGVMVIDRKSGCRIVNTLVRILISLPMCFC
jgi:hypothetical protein